MSIGIALVVCVLGGLICVIATNPRASELGRLAFAIGLFIALSGAGQAVALFVK
jgi:hypothetical protein